MAWLTGWNYRKSHTINAQAGAGTNYQVKITVHYGAGADSSGDVYLNEKCRTDFGDIRFTDDDGSTLLDYWIEEKVDSDYAVIWVEIADSLESSAQTIYVYYYKADATYPFGNDQAKMDATFLFADHFYGSSLDTDKWTVASGSVTVSGSVVTVQGDDLRGDVYFAAGKRWRCRSKTYTDVDLGDPCATLDNNVSPLHWLLIRRNPVQVEGSYWLTGTSNSAGTTLNGIANPGTNFNVWEITWTNTAVQFIRNDNLLETHTTNIPTKDQRWRFLSITNNPQIDVDWVFTSKYVSPEPAHGAWGTEETESQAEDLEVGNLTVYGTTTAYDIIEGKQNWPHIYDPRDTTYTPLPGEVTVHDLLYSDVYNNPLIGAKIRNDDLGSGYSADIYGALFKNPAEAPATVCSHHLIIRKDLTMRGMIDSYEGILSLHGGPNNIGWGPSTARNPFIWLANGGIYGSNDTLEIRIKNYADWGWGDLAFRNLIFGEENQAARITLKGSQGNRTLYLEQGEEHARAHLDLGNLYAGGTVQAAGYKASDGTEGATADIAISGTTLHFKNGLFVGIN